MNRYARTCRAALAALVTFPVLSGAALAQVVRFRTGDATLAALGSPVERQRALSAALASPDARHLLIQFNGPLSLNDRAALEAAGLHPLSYLPDFAFFAGVDPATVNVAAIAAVPAVRSIAPIQTPWKLHPLLLAGTPPTYTVAPTPDGKPAKDPVVAVYILFHADAPMGLAADKTVIAHAGSVVGTIMSMPVVVAKMPLSQVAALAAEDSVMWIEPAMPVMEAVSIPAAPAPAMWNDSNRARTEANVVQGPPYNLDGTGITAFVFDAGTALDTHATFTQANGSGQSRVTKIEAVPSGVVSHSTHCAGTIGGNGSGEAGNPHKGMAPNANILSAGLSTTGCGPAATGPWFLYNCTFSLTDMENDYNLAINHPTLPAAIASNSIGTNTSTNGFPCSLEGDYGLTDALIDNIVRGSLGRPMRVVWANGNERQSSACLTNHGGVSFGGFYLTAPPATAKNHITCGALNSNDDSMTSFSSWGPTDDGRMKPDISGPGCEVGSDAGVTSSTSASNTSYGAMCGTSMATPTVCGLSALLLQDYRATYPTLADPRNSTLKAILAHTAVDLLNAGPDYKSGYGSVRIQKAIDFTRTGRFLEAQVNQGGTFSQNILVGAGQPLKVTLAWDDVAGTPNSSGAAALVNDLDLRLVAPDNTVFFPWTLDPNSPDSLAVRTAANRRDNIEQVLVDNPAAGSWRVEVVGFNVPSGPQVFSLVGGNPTTVGLNIAIGTPLPSVMVPGSNVTVDVTITPVNQLVVPGSAVMFSRLGAAAFVSTPLTFVSGNLYHATVTAPPCNQSLNFYFSATGTVAGTVADPATAPAAFFAATSGSDATVFGDNFETDQGWTVTSAPAGGTFAGPWERGIPIASAGGPSTDADGSGQCFVTGLVANNDVDFGSTTLTSPIMDASGGNVTLSYSRWFSRTSSSIGSDGLWDQFLVETSTNGGSSWTTLEVIGQTSGTITGAWVPKTFAISGGTNQFRVRFTANDNIINSQAVEAGVDAVRLTRSVCTNPCPADWDHDGSITPADVAAFINSWLSDLNNGTTLADFDGNGSTQPADVAFFVTTWFNALSNGC